MDFIVSNAINATSFDLQLGNFFQRSSFCIVTIPNRLEFNSTSCILKFLSEIINAHTEPFANSLKSLAVSSKNEGKVTIGG